MAHAPLHDPIADPGAQAGHPIRRATCGRCACRCRNRVRRREGRVRCIDGNRDHRLNPGVLGAKGRSGITKPCAPLRRPSAGSSLPRRGTRRTCTTRQQPESL